MDAFGRHAVGASRDEHAYGSVDEPRRIVVAVSAPRAVDEHDILATKLREPPPPPRLGRERAEAGASFLLD
jgi:hypothetical protein